MKLPLESIQMSDSAIDSLASKRIYFGHMSVGYNMMKGVENVIKSDARLSAIRVIELAENDTISAPGFYHGKNGKNSFPDTKCDAFKNLLFKNDFAKNLDIAFFKFCYVDLKDNSDVQKIFNYYVSTVEGVKSAFPHLKIVHVTVPLKSHCWGMKEKVKRLFQTDVSNIKRNEFNTLLLEKYSGHEPVFDLAGIESTCEDGSRTSFKHNGNVYYSLNDRYTYDGGHLNAEGSLLAGRALVQLLSEISL
ncbi:MAG: hypothetical protein ACOY90_22655 [Candidatus Zhuqueibacterota bacterium]